MSEARADEIEDFEQALQAYRAGDFPESVTLFESMVGGAVPRIRNPALVLESRKYLAASYLFVGREVDAKEQFTALLRADISYVLDPSAFPRAVVNLFREVKEEVATELADAERQRREAAERLERESIERDIARQERIARLEELARQEVVEDRNSRLVATVPFGVGQFQNNHLTLGRFFAVSEATLIAGTFATWGVHQWAKNQIDQFPGSQARLERIGTAMRGLNYTFFGLAAALVVIGIIDSHVRFVPVHRETRERELPEDLTDPLPERGPSATLGLGAGSLEFRLDF
ncbi:MAG: hypothetical protein JJ863_10490 [Deltaproteobacteria bacterium]|nr:hypothetical protein [Deltaproteobacteria bacterium]